jgi:hypothetical protein
MTNNLIKKLPGGVGDNTPSDKIDPAQLSIGVQVEMEHTNDPEIAKEIAMDHLTEDPEYYTKLVNAGLAKEFQAGTGSGIGDPTTSLNDPARIGAGGLKKGNMHGSIGGTSDGQVDGRRSEPVLNKTIDVELEEQVFSSLEEALLDEKKRRKKGKGKRKPKPTNPALWARAKSAARAKFDVYPCVPLDSKALTKNGWKSYEELNKGELILTYNIEKDELEWKPIINLNFFENAEMMRMYKPTGFSIKCTPNHKWVVRRGNDYSTTELIETKDLPKRSRIVMCAELKTENKILLEDFSKFDNWTENVINMNSDQRKAFLAASIIYDGWDKGTSSKIEGRHTFGFVQKNSDHLDAGLLAAYLSGYYVSVNDRDYITSANFIRNKKYHSVQNIKFEKVENEDVWCPTTENNTWVMYQNGLITITGNSAYANGWAAKWYKSKGGGWRMSEDVDESVVGQVFDGSSPTDASCDGVGTYGSGYDFVGYAESKKSMKKEQLRNIIKNLIKESINEIEQEADITDMETEMPGDSTDGGETKTQDIKLTLDRETAQKLHDLLMAQLATSNDTEGGVEQPVAQDMDNDQLPPSMEAGQEDELGEITFEQSKEIEETKKKWIQNAIKPGKKGALHKQLGVSQGEKIPTDKLAAAAKKGGKVGQRARLAMTLKKLKKK